MANVAPSIIKKYILGKRQKELVAEKLRVHDIVTAKIEVMKGYGRTMYQKGR